MLPWRAVSRAPTPPIPASHALPASRQAAIVLVGILVGQVVLYGPSLLGSKILLPLDILAQGNIHIPRSPGADSTPPHNFVLSDLVLQKEPNRIFAAREIRSGRLPWWNPYQYAGAPHLQLRLSPFSLLSELTESPQVLPWVQLLVAFLAGLGAFAFCRKALKLSFWPSAISAWCHPLTAFFVFWLGYGYSHTLLMLPWLLLAVDRTICAQGFVASIGLALITGLTLICVFPDVAGQMMIVAGLFAIWCFLREFRGRLRSRAALRTGCFLLLGWALGFMLAAPEILSIADYAATGSRMIRRSHGSVERPPFGLAALPEIVLPNIYGSTEDGSVRLAPTGHKNQMEGAAAAYAGLVATLLLVPLAWQNRRHRATTIFFAVIGFVGLGWCLNVPGLTGILRLPGLNMMSHNRFVFATSMAIIILAAIGLESLWQGEVRWRPWFWLPVALVATLAVWCVASAIHLPAFLADRLQAAVKDELAAGLIRDGATTGEIRKWFTRAYATGAVLCGLTLIGWMVLRNARVPQRWLVFILGVVLPGELLWFGHGWNAQCDPRLYYPRIPVLDEIAKSTPGRVVGFHCLPAVLAQTSGLRDVRGYDAIDPLRLTSLIAPVAGPEVPAFPYASIQWFSPRLQFSSPEAVKLPPVLDMLAVRYVIFRGTPGPGIMPAFAGGDYFAMVNPSALARVFVPRHVEYLPEAKERIRRLTSDEFDGRATAYVESPVDLPNPIIGRAEISSEVPTRITVSVHMETSGLVVLADLFDAGWRAYLQGQPVPIFRANHAVRGVIVPAGDAVLEFRYRPAGFVWGIPIFGVAMLILLGWSVVLIRQRRRTSKSAA